MRVKDALGRWGEQVAVDHLTAAGLVVVDRNWRCSTGELDLIARDGTVLAFVEVKTRSTDAFGLPVEAVTPAKQSRLRALSLRWLDEHRDERGTGWSEIRYDVVGVTRAGRDHGMHVHYLRGAF